MKKNMFLTFCCALVPGCGQMYQGYMKRGFSLLFWFCGVIAFAALTYTEALFFILPVIWAYSFFDTFNIRNLSPEQRAAFGDFFIPGTKWVQGTGADKWLKNIRFGKVAGWALVALGVVILYSNVWDTLYSYVWNFSPGLALWVSRLPGIAIAVVVIIIGVRILTGGRKNNTQDFGAGQEDDHNA